MTPQRRLRFALDQNFPDPLLATLAEILPFVELVEALVRLHRLPTKDLARATTVKP